VRWVFDAGALYLFTRKPVESIADVKGQRIRYPAGESWRLALQGLGAEPLALPFTEVVSALQTNLIDGLITDFTGGVSYYSLKDFTPYAVLVAVSIQPIAIVANTKWWNTLTEEQRAAIQEMFDILDTSRFYDRLTDREIENWRAIAGMKAVEPADAADWRKAMQGATQSAITDIDPNLLKAIHGVE
jgi:TRAP-type C4-dicarboxylate transport system substrate-binding protein